MTVHLLLAIGVVLASLSCASPRRAAAPPPEAAAVAPTSLRVGRIGARPDGLLDVARGRPASAALRRGSVYVAAVLAERPDAPHRAAVFEWDVAGGKVLRSVILPPHAGDEVGGVRIATAGDRVYVAAFSSYAAPIRLTAMSAELATIATRDLRAGTNVSLEATDQWVAIAMEVQEPAEMTLHVMLFEARNLALVTEHDVGAAVTTVRADELELFAGRLYVVGRRLGRPTRHGDEGAIVDFTMVFALALPSLRVVASTRTNHGAWEESSLVSDDAHLYLHQSQSGELVELSADLRAGRTREVGGDPLAFGPDGTMFDAGRAARQSDVLGEHETGDCRPVWSAGGPLLACAGDDDIYIVTGAALE